MQKVEITMERSVRICKEFVVTNEQLEDLKAGINPFHGEFESDLLTGDGDYDFAVCDEKGMTIVDWR